MLFGTTHFESNLILEKIKIFRNFNFNQDQTYFCEGENKMKSESRCTDKHSSAVQISFIWNILDYEEEKTAYVTAI
jgi:hypothetical protein